MKNIYINGRYLTQNITGVQRYAREIVEAMDKIIANERRFNVTILTPKLNFTPPKLQNISYRAVGHLQGHAWEQFDLPRHCRKDYLFCPGNTAPLLSLINGTRTIVTLHDLSYRYFPKAYSRKFKFFYELIIPIILRLSKAVITVSESEKNAIRKIYPGVRNLISIQNGGPPGDFINDFHQSELQREQSVLYVGSLSKRKNFPGMIATACKLAGKDGIKFIFIGGIPDGLVESNIKIPSDLKDFIEFRGQVSDWESLMHEYSTASCFFFPSFYEASPLPPIEAMACGCPVIASRIPSLLERCGEAALYCDPTDVDDMANKIIQVLKDAEIRSSLRELGYKRAREFTWDRCARITLNTIDSI